MKRCLNSFIFLIIAVILVVQGVAVSETNSLDSHLNLYPVHEYADTTHDNIDTTERTHVHKHSDEDEEHDHSHEHFNFSHNIVLLFDRGFEIASNLVASKSQSNFLVELHISTRHPSTIFRPPIVIV